MSTNKVALVKAKDIKIADVFSFSALGVALGAFYKVTAKELFTNGTVQLQYEGLTVFDSELTSKHGKDMVDKVSGDSELYKIIGR
jgi:hypothetical protein